MRIRVSIFLLLFSTTSFVLSQKTNICGTDLMMNKNIQKYNSEYLTNKLLLENTINNRSHMETKIIPVVFHIIHDGHPIGEDENISTLQVQDAINIMNEDFNTLNEDLENVIDTFENIVGNVNLEFRLAQLDPNGDCSNGITRTFSNMTNGADDCIKDLINWDDSKYLNIWVVEDISSEIGAAAYTYLPSSPYVIHGIVANHQYVGSIGSSSGSAYAKHTLTHEVGHFFNLSHTWGEYAPNGDPDNCSEDDNVSDTPNTIGSNSTCNLSQETCGSLDNIQNFMDYSMCTSMFTNGQVDRMQNSLNSFVGDRFNLWQEDNLYETGVGDNFMNFICNPNVDFFISEPERICMFSPITLINNSETLGNNPVFSWSFFGAEPEFSSEENPTIIYSEPGEYAITLNIITDDNGENSITKTYTVYNSSTNLIEGFESNQFPLSNYPNLSWSIQAPEDETSWTRTYLASTEGTASVRIRSRYFDCYRKHMLYTPNLDLSNFGLGIGEPLKLWFDIAYGKRNNQTDDLLVVSYSKDCGETWQVRGSWTTDQLMTNNGSNVGNNFVPDNNEWVEKSVNIQAAAEQNDVIIRFEFSGDRGSYLYVDNVRLTGEWININENNFLNENQIVKKIDLLGRENNKSKFYINIYNDGTIKKIYEVQ